MGGAPTESAVGSRALPCVLAVVEDRNRLGDVKRALEESGHIQIAGVTNLDEAYTVLANPRFTAAAVLFPWISGEKQIGRFVAAVSRLRLPHRPYLLAYETMWYPESLNKAVDLGIDSFLPWPVTLKILIAELLGLRKNGRGPMRARMLAQASSTAIGTASERSDEERWKMRMFELANSGGKRAVPASDPRVKEVVDRLEQVAGRPMDMRTLEAMMMMVQGEARQLDQLAAGGIIVADEIRQLCAVVRAASTRKSTSVIAGARAEMLLAGVMAYVSERGDEVEVTPEYAEVGRRAADVLANAARRMSGSQLVIRFHCAFGAWMGLSASYLTRLDGILVRRMCARFVAERFEDRARHFARLMLLGYILRERRDSSASNQTDPDRLKALSEVLAMDGGGLDELKQFAGEMMDDPSFAEEDMPDFGEFSDLFADVAAMPPEELAALGLENLRDQLKSLAALAQTDAATGESAEDVVRSAALASKVGAELGVDPAFVAECTGGLIDAAELEAMTAARPIRCASPTRSRPCWRRPATRGSSRSA